MVGAFFMKGSICKFKGEILDYSEQSEKEYQVWDRRRYEEPEPDYHTNVNGEFMEPKNSMSFMSRLGIAVLSLMLIICSGAYFIPKTIAASNPSTRKLPIYCVNTDKPRIAISFDAAWGNEQTQTILDILAQHNVKATFFMTGTWIEKYPDSVKAIAAAGHDLGNHSENHKQMSKLSKSQCIDELMKPHEKVKQLTGTDMTLFRPPYGDYNNTLIEAATDCKYHTIQWDVDSLDWKDYGAKSIVKEVCQNKHLGNGSIILCHNGAKYILDALDTILTTLQNEGYEFCKISDLIYTENYYMDHEGRQFQK